MPIDLKTIPYFDQYFGIWCMEETQFWSQFETIRSANLHVHLDSAAVAAVKESAGAKAESVGNVAIVQLSGKLMKQESSMGGGTSTVAARRMIRMLGADPNISAIMLLVDSPGGTVAGTAELADDVSTVAKIKPVHAYIEDLGASAAYYIASQASHISINAAGMAGSIGVFTVVYDSSGAAAMDGIKAHVVKAGKYKGAGAPGTEVTPEQLAEMQRTVDAMYSQFVSAVASGRKMSQDKVESLADGRVHVGREALSLGLVDAVESFDAAFLRLQQATVKQRSNRMTVDHVIPQQEVIVAALADVPQNTGGTGTVIVQQASPASYGDLKSGCVGADADFICQQLEAKATLPQAQQAWMLEQNKRIEAAKAQLSKPGVNAVSTSGQTSTSEDASASFWSLVNDKVKAGMARPKAISSVVKSNPELHSQMLVEANEGRKPRE